MDMYQETLYPYYLKQFLVASIYVFMVIDLMLLVFLIAHKSVTEKRETRSKRWVRDYHLQLDQYLLLRISPKKPHRHLQYAAFADVCVEVISNSSQGIGDRIRQLLKTTGTLEHFKQRAVTSSWIQRFCAIEMIGFFRMEDLNHFIIETIGKDKHPEVRAKAIWALSLTADRDSLSVITRMLSSGTSLSSKFNVYVCTNLIQSFKKRQMLDVWVQYLREIKEDDQVPLILKRDYIESCGATTLIEAVDVIRQYYDAFAEDPLVKMACIRALGAIGHLDEGLTIEGLTDNDWRVRAVAAKAIHLADDVVLSFLRESLYDSAYYVRINAARKLEELGTKGLRILKGEIHSTDPFVKDTVRFILEGVRYA